MADFDQQAASFEEYASRADLTPEETWTVEVLIDLAQAKFDPNYWSNRREREEARSAPDYEPQFPREFIIPSARTLQNMGWVSFQRIGKAKRPVRDLTALRYLPKLSGLVLMGNEVSDLSPLSCCLKPRFPELIAALDCPEFKVRDLLVHILFSRSVLGRQSCRPPRKPAADGTNINGHRTDLSDKAGL